MVLSSEFGFNSLQQPRDGRIPKSLPLLVSTIRITAIQEIPIIRFGHLGVCINGEVDDID